MLPRDGTNRSKRMKRERGRERGRGKREREGRKGEGRKGEGGEEGRADVDVGVEKGSTFQWN